MICNGKITMEIHQNNWSFEQIYSLELWFTMETLCHYGKYYDTMEKNYGTQSKTMELWFSMEKKLWYYSKKNGTTVNYSLA